MITLNALIRDISEDQRVQITYTDEIGNDYKIYDGEAGMLRETLEHKIGDIRVKELNVQSGGILWIDADINVTGSSAVKWMIEQILANYGED